MKVEAALGLGGNLGDVVSTFATALSRLKNDPRAGLGALSSVYRTAPWGITEQPDFLNMAVTLRTEASPTELLALVVSLEQAAGRERRERWGPRTLDIDILSYGDLAIDRPMLQLPHPRIARRAFVLVPLAEIAPDLKIGSDSVAQLLAALPDRNGVERDEEATAQLRAKLAL